jgi:hypothetical protein
LNQNKNEKFETINFDNDINSQSKRITGDGIWKWQIWNIWNDWNGGLSNLVFIIMICHSAGLSSIPRQDNSLFLMNWTIFWTVLNWTQYFELRTNVKNVWWKCPTILRTSVN